MIIKKLTLHRHTALTNLIYECDFLSKLLRKICTLKICFFFNSIELVTAVYHKAKWLLDIQAIHNYCWAFNCFYCTYIVQEEHNEKCFNWNRGNGRKAGEHELGFTTYDTRNWAFNWLHVNIYCINGSHTMLHTYACILFSIDDKIKMMY